MRWCILTCGGWLARMQNFRFLFHPRFTLAAILQRRIDAFYNLHRRHGNIRKISAQPVAAQRNFGCVHIVALRIVFNRFFIRCRFWLVLLLFVCVERNTIAGRLRCCIRFFCCLHDRRLRRRLLLRRLLNDRFHLRGRRRCGRCRSDRRCIDGLRGWCRRWRDRRRISGLRGRCRRTRRYH